MHRDPTRDGADAAASKGEPAKPALRTFRGRYHSGFEVSSFQPDAINERWWVSFRDHSAGETREVIEAARGAAIEVEFSGELSTRGEYGHMGLYHREFVVHEIRRETK